MKRQVQSPGIRKWSGDDLIGLQGEGLSVADKFFSEYGNCVIAGCQVSEGGISSGLVSIGGMVMPFEAVTGIEVFPIYLVRDEKHIQREYADDVVRDITVEYFAKTVQEKPEGEYIEVTEKGAPRFLGNIQPADGNAETPTLEEKPTVDTLTYESGGGTRDFSIGQQCRVLDAEAGMYVFYQLYDITEENKADWQVVSSEGSSLSERMKITLSSNQGAGDTALSGAAVTITYADRKVDLEWNGQELSAAIPMEEEYQVACGDIAGYLTPEMQTYTAEGGNQRQLSFAYSTEKVTVNVSTDDKADCSGCTVNLVDTASSTVIGTGQGASVTLNVPSGISYKVSADELPGYKMPPEETFTADSANRTISFEYEKVVDGSIVFDKSISDPENITGDINSGVIKTILSKFRRCLCKKTAEGEVTIAYLKDADSNYYEDESPALLDGTEGDVMVDFPEFYYKWESVDENKYRYRFALNNVDGDFKHVPRSLVGAYKAFMANNKLFSQSGVKPVVSSPDFGNYAKTRGTGYQLIDFQQHCVIAFMLFAKYGNRDLQAVLGTGGVSWQSNLLTGSTNLIGNNDTVNETSGFVNGLGIEGVFGGLNEFGQGVSIENYVWSILDPDGTTRTVKSSEGEGWISKVAAEDGEFFDMVPVALDGSETTCYADYGQTNPGTAYFIRSGDRGVTSYGVSYVFALTLGGSVGVGENIGTRLAFRGTINEAENVEAFKALPVL